MKPSGGQIIFNLWHGSPLKAIGKMIGHPVNPETDTYFLSTSPFWASINEKCFGHTQGQMFIGSNPRNDLLFNKIDTNVLIPASNGKKVILFMPTFRNSVELGRHDAQKDFPLLTSENINSFDDFLSKKNLMLIIKPHPYQNKIDFLSNPYKNIKVIFNKDLKQLGIKLYELLGRGDALITDFSSVYFDYLLLDRPIGFAIDDMENYAVNRGYTVEDPLSIMPGPKIKDMEGLKKFVCDIVDGVDNYREERYKINDLVNTYKTGDACQRILDFIEIRK
jgi:CDP-glycerol glycerophosphotransferase (TagB/SpsB family)